MLPLTVLVDAQTQAATNFLAFLDLTLGFVQRTNLEHIGIVPAFSQGRVRKDKLELAVKGQQGFFVPHNLVVGRLIHGCGTAGILPLFIGVSSLLITREISVGDYVVSGGEIPAALLADSIIRLIPGALTDETSALSDSFQDNLLSPPVYTRPAEFNGWKVPDILLSGNPRLIKEWQDRIALERTEQLRPELLKKH